MAVRPNKGDVNFRLSEGTISRVGISLVEVYERLGISVIKVCKKAQKAGLNGGTSITLNPFFGSVYGRGGRSWGGGCLQGNRWFSPPGCMTSRLASVTFKIASKVFIEETDKNFEFIREINMHVLISWIWRYYDPCCHRKPDFCTFSE